MAAAKRVLRYLKHANTLAITYHTRTTLPQFDVLGLRTPTGQEKKTTGNQQRDMVL